MAAKAEPTIAIKAIHTKTLFHLILNLFFALVLIFITSSKYYNTNLINFEVIKFSFR